MRTLSKNFTLSAALAALLVLSGAGCSFSNSNSKTPASTTPTIIKKPATETAYEDWQKKQIEQALQANLDHEESATELNCDNSSEAVCGVNIQTYQNECTAAWQKIAILHTGPCTVNDSPPGSTPFLTPPPAPKTSKTSPKKTTTQPAEPGITQKNDVGLPIWLELSTDLILESDPVFPRAKLSACNIGSDTYYLQSGGEQQTLYSKTGVILCYPSFALTSCPSNFQTAGSGSCQEIWHDER